MNLLTPVPRSVSDFPFVPLVVDGVLLVEGIGNPPGPMANAALNFSEISLSALIFRIIDIEREDG